MLNCRGLKATEGAAPFASAIFIKINVHRFIEGKNGGKYEIGNMFAICPNHHGEYHARLINFEKISDCELKII